MSLPAASTDRFQRGDAEIFAVLIIMFGAVALITFLVVDSLNSSNCDAFGKTRFLLSTVYECKKVEKK
jgi:hypothetical protein